MLRALSCRSFKKIILWLTIILGFQYALNIYACNSKNGTLCPPTDNTFVSNNHELNIVMIAHAPSKLTLFSPKYTNIIPWTWSICYLRDFNPTSQTCHNTISTNHQYAGPLLQLQQGDTLNITLINQLPPALNIANQSMPGLSLNPTNIHTHGLIVSPHTPYPGNETYGDNIFVMLFNPLNGTYDPGSGHHHGMIIYNSVNYSIKIPQSHPSGLYWIHPHLHGLTSAQVSAGMRGLITIGHVRDYVSIPLDPNWDVDANTSYLALQDSQILADVSGQPATLNTNPDPAFCLATPNASEGATPRQGVCPGTDFSAIGGADYTGGAWYHTVSGLIYPSIQVTNQQVFAIANVSDSSTYNLQLQKRQHSKCNMLMQILSVDGIAIDTSNAQAVLLAAGSKFIPEVCPDTNTLAFPYMAVCTSSLLMMPSARAEVLVAYRDCDTDNKLTSAPFGAQAILRTTAYNTGPTGDYWPTIDFAEINFTATTKGHLAHVTTPNFDPVVLASQLEPANSQVKEAPCQPLPSGYKRRIFYGNPQSAPDEFGLAYEVIDQNGNVVGTPATELIAFSEANASICVPMGKNNTPATEVWELVNVAPENHNFHIHQHKFMLISETDILTGEVVPSSGSYLLDNVPIPHALGNCGQTDGSNPIANWRSKQCISAPLTIQLSFVVAGDYVYHCHILQHEDGGMMAKIRVIPFPVF